MKISWGTGIVIAFFVYNLHFVFCFTVQSDSKYDNELVVEYYKHDAHFGDEMHVYKMQLI
jgi:hypothetical protein